MARKAGPGERRIVALLGGLVRRAAVRAHIDAAVSRLERRLASDPGARMAWETVPLALFDPGLPETIRSIWVFTLRGGVATGAERHPNSHQRTLSWLGAGDLQTMRDGRWRSHRLVSDADAPAARRWISIPPNTWHQVIVRGGHWTVLSFHTAPADELVEERPRPDDPRGRIRRLYAGESAR